MPRNLHYYRAECENLLSRISDEETEHRFEDALEVFYNDIPSLIELSEDMREELRSQRMFR